MITSKPSLRSGFECIICPAPSGAGRTTPSQPGHYPLNNTALFLSCDVKNTKFNQYLPMLLTSLNGSISKFSETYNVLNVMSS